MPRRVRREQMIVVVSAAAILVGAAMIWRTVGSGGASPNRPTVGLEGVIATFDRQAATGAAIDLPPPAREPLDENPRAAEAVERAERAVGAALRDAPDRRRWRGGAEPVDQGPKLATSEQRRKLADLVARWLTLRAAIATDAYVEWMLGRGCEWRTEYEEQTPPHAAYAHYAGEPPSEEIARREIFRVPFEGGLRDKGGVTRPVELASMEMRFGRCAGGSIEQCLMPDQPGERWWVGSYLTGARSHFVPPVTYEQVVARHGEALCAIVYLACRTATDNWSTYRVLCYFDPESEIWHIHALAHQSLTANTMGVAVEF